MISKLSLYLDNHQYENVPSLIKIIKEKLNNFDSEFKGLKLTYLPEVCAYEIEYLSQQRPLNINRLRQLHRESLRVSTVLTHPRILGIIKECGGRLKFYRDNFEKARLDFYEAFKCYDEVGSQLKNQILKYVILCSIVTDHEANPFESQETQAYTQLSDYENLVALYDAYECLNLRRLQEVINDFKLSSDPLASDDIFLKSTALILDNLKSKILVRILSSFKSISFDTLTRLLEIELNDLDKRITHLVSEGVIFDIMVDYVSKVIFTGVTSNNIVTVDASSVLTNTKILDGLKWFEFSDFVKSMNPKSTEMVTSTLSCIVYTFSDSGISEQLEEWLRVIVTGIPTKRRNGLSQKDQVLYELAVDSANNRKDDNNNNNNNNNNNIEGQNSSRALKNTNAGILGSALTMDDDEEEDPDQNEDTISPDKAIREWCNALNDIRRGF
ncbi:uncharacterized protein KQ657_001073 [Scheffersomyces spartinae]|uniref:PCI domain-containing protein n=1 Tax=Scheffersomyces spartinae TaxID=45513 RepID=A0A9P7V8U7_9ASCO|nr:uncharacterized protein KQ657_001073 [Scheffersomyces spartinae]KAG7192967.1 hypothetical protein KQ657_001073 [Scheffersomyces spartinae]